MTPLRIFLSFISLKTISCDVSSLSGYHYPQPQPPVQLDEPSTPSSAYLPPIYQDEPPQPPLNPHPTYLPPNLYPPLGTSPPDIFSDDDSVVIPTPATLYQAPTPQPKVLNMSCVLDSSFKSVFRIDGRVGPPPVVDDGAEGCISTRSSGSFVINAEGGKKMSECGVRRCTSSASPRANMCVVVRMPTVRGLKLPEDGLVTLQCTPQDTVVAHTKHIRLGPTTNNKGRSANNGVVASGGGQRNFDSKMILLRKSPGSHSFDQPLLPGSVVQLGEELVLRAVVQDGDGWKASRMGPVIVRSANSKKSVTLIEENGCRSPGMKSICPFQPRQISPLDTILHFRAFLFQSSSKGDDMLVSVRMLGCLNIPDCYQNGGCNDINLVSQLRFKRNANANNRHLSEKENDTTNWESHIQFRVQVPTEKKLPGVHSVSKEFLIIGSMFLICLSLIVALFGLYFKKTKQSI